MLFDARLPRSLPNTRFGSSLQNAGIECQLVSADGRGQCSARHVKGFLHLRRTNAVSDTREERNGHRRNSFSVLVQDRKADVYNTVHLITRQLFVSTPANFVEMACEPARNWSARAAAPCGQHAGMDLIALKGEDNVPGSCVQKIDVGA